MKKKILKPIIKFLILTDTHFGIHYTNKSRSKLRFAFGNQFFDQANKIFKLAIDKHKVDFVLHCGDFFNRSKPHPVIIAKATSILLWLAKYVPVYIVPGNHERSKLPIGLLHFQENIHIFTKPCSFFFRKREVVVKITGIPYIRHNIKSDFKSLVDKAWKTEINPTEFESSYNILILHQLIQGSKIEHYTFNYGNNVITIDEIPLHFHLIAVGHVHRFQFLYSLGGHIHSSHTIKRVIQDIEQNNWKFIHGKKNDKNCQFPVICYPGSCEKVSMMERNENKGYTIGIINLNTSKAFYEFYPINSVPMMKMKWKFSAASKLGFSQQIYNEINQLASLSCLKELGGILRIIHSDDINPNTLTDVAKFAKQKKVILNVSNNRY